MKFLFPDTRVLPVPILRDFSIRELNHLSLNAKKGEDEILQQ